VPGTRPRYPVPGTGDWGQVPVPGTWNRCREAGTVPGTWYRVPRYRCLVPGTGAGRLEPSPVPGTAYLEPGTGIRAGDLGTGTGGSKRGPGWAQYYERAKAASAWGVADGRPVGGKWPVGWSRWAGVSGKKWGKSKFGRRWWHRGCSEEAVGNAEIS